MSDYKISDGFTIAEVKPITTSTKYLAEQLELLGTMYNSLLPTPGTDEKLSTDEQMQLDALIHWLTEILEEALLASEVLLEVTE